MFGILLAFCVISALLPIVQYERMAAVWRELPHDADGNLLNNLSLTTYSLYNSWLGGLPTGVAPVIFYNLLPLVVAIPYASSAFEDLHSGYANVLIAQCGRRKYYLCRYVAVFVSGAVVILVPLLVNYALVACFIPARMPDSTENLYFQVYYDTLWGTLFYLKPWLYDILYLLLNALFAGVWATVPLACSLFLDSKLAITIVPFVGLTYLSYAAKQALVYRVWLTVAPVELIRPISVGDAENGWVLLAELVFTFAVTFSVVMVKGCRDDVL
ncbi:MAG: hypothetical protein PHG73_04710 [Pygmaiobacter sp.]|nr:hypothetical protein [Pygmaiobacter sp.]